MRNIKLMLVLVIMLVSFIGNQPAIAQRHGGHSSGGSHTTASPHSGGGGHSSGRSSHSTGKGVTHNMGGPVHVKGYYRKDGTYVSPHNRRASGSSVPRVRSSTTRYNYAHYASGFLGARDVNGRIVRSEAAKRAFMGRTGYLHGRPGYVVDHVIPLKRGGADDPRNMQWQTIQDAKAKDKWE